jgi:hypothetical protein
MQQDHLEGYSTPNTFGVTSADSVTRSGCVTGAD